MPEIARWSNLKANARARDLEITDPTTGKPRRVDIGGLIDAAMEAIEKANEATLKGVLPKDYGRPALDKQMIGDFVELFSDIGMHEEGEVSKDPLGRAYEYFLSGFAGAEGKRGGEFFTPRSVVCMQRFCVCQSSFCSIRAALYPVRRARKKVIKAEPCYA